MPRILIAVQSCVAHRDREKAQRETWFKDLKRPLELMVFDGTLLGCADDYDSLPAKTKAMCQWAYQRGFDYFFKTDTDTYLSIDRLLASGFEQHDYSGYVLDWITGYPYCSGPHYWLSKKAIRILAEADWSKYPVPGANGWEDSKVGGVLAAHGIHPHHDYRYAPWERVLPDNDIISCHLSSAHKYEIPMMYEAHRLAKEPKGTSGPRIALLFIATGENYYSYIWPALESAQHFFPPHTPFLWTDAYRKFVSNQYQIPHEGHPATITHRYNIFEPQREELSKFDYIFHCDIDMRFAAHITEEHLVSEGITATLHPGFLNQSGTPERRPESSAYLPEGSQNKYFCGAFVGGKSEAYLKMMGSIAAAARADDQKGLTALWFDESHLNRYLFHNPPARILTPSFCYPEDYDGRYGWTAAQYPPMLVALEKNKLR